MFERFLSIFGSGLPRELSPPTLTFAERLAKANFCKDVPIRFSCAAYGEIMEDPVLFDNCPSVLDLAQVKNFWKINPERQDINPHTNKIYKKICKQEQLKREIENFVSEIQKFAEQREKLQIEITLLETKQENETLSLSELAKLLLYTKQMAQIEVQENNFLNNEYQKDAQAQVNSSKIQIAILKDILEKIEESEAPYSDKDSIENLEAKIQCLLSKKNLSDADELKLKAILARIDYLQIPANQALLYKEHGNDGMPIPYKTNRFFLAEQSPQNIGLEALLETSKNKKRF